MRHLGQALCLTIAIALTACGTTVEGPDTSLTASGGAFGAPAAGETGGRGGVAGPGGTSTTVAGPGAGTASGSNPDTAGLPGTEGPGQPPPGGSSPPSGDVGRGVTDKTISVGIPVEKGGQEAADAFGVSGFSTTSQAAIFDSIIADINESGGVLGRKLKPVYHPVDVAQFIANPSQVTAEICADYGTDRPVLAIIIGVTTSGLRDCSAKMGSPLVLMSGLPILPGSEYAENGGNYLFGINSITTDRLSELFIESLMERDFDEKWNTVAGGPGLETTKMAVIHVDTPEIHAMYDAYERELGHYGYRFEETVTYPQEASQALAATQSAVLRFKSAGVTHVFGASVFFLQAAESQGYRPRYAYLPGLGQVGVDNAPAEQMRGALTVGWAPASDVGSTKDPGDTRGAARCRATMKAGGLNATKRADQRVMYNACDGAYSLAAALAAGGSPTARGLRAGFESLGDTFPTAFSFRSMVSASRHAGIDSVRDMAYDSACHCLYYTSSKDRS